MSISSRITAIEEHIGNAYDKLEDVGIDLTNVDKNIDNIASMLEEVWQGYPKVSATGTELTLDGTKVGKLGLDIKGNSTQETTTGYQLFQDEYINAPSNSINAILSAGTYTLATVDGNSFGKNIYFKLFKNGAVVTSDGHLTSSTHILNFSTTSYTYYGGSSSSYITFTLDDAYNLNIGLLDATGTRKVVLVSGSTIQRNWEKYTGGIASPNPSFPQEIYSAGDNVNLFDKDNANILNNVYIGSSSLGTSNGAKTLYINCKSSTTYTVSRIAGQRFIVGDTSTTPASGVSVSNRTADNTGTKITITTSSTAKYLVVFYYLSSADTLTEQQILDSIKIAESPIATPYSPYNMGSITEKISNKNLAQHIGGYLTNAGVFKTSSDDSFYFYVIKGQTYIYNCTGNRTNAAIFNKIPENNDTCIIGTYLSPLSKNTPFVAQETGYMVVYANTPTSTDTINSFIANAGSTILSYEPHAEQTYTIPVQQPMRSIGDVKDEFIKVNGNWFERHNIGRKIFDGTESFGLTQTQPDDTSLKSITTTISTKSPGATNALISNYYIYKGNHGIIKTSITECCWNNGGSTDRRIGFITKETSIENFKTWLATKYANATPVYVDYVLETPQDLPCTEEQISILENLPKSYNEQTNIYSLDVTPAYVEAKALKGE